MADLFRLQPGTTMSPGPHRAASALPRPASPRLQVQVLQPRSTPAQLSLFDLPGGPGKRFWRTD